MQRDFVAKRERTNTIATDPHRQTGTYTDLLLGRPAQAMGATHPTAGLTMFATAIREY